LSSRKPNRGFAAPLHLQLHQPLRRKADHLAQQIGVGALLKKLAKVDLVLGHRRHLQLG
jgi:hypothetical protein